MPFYFDVTNLPNTSFYTVSIGGRNAGTYSRAQLTKAKWSLQLSLGD